MRERERLAATIRWPYFRWIFGLLNACAMLPQLHQLVRTRETAGISIAMFWVILAVQLGYSLDGYFSRNRMVMWSLAAASLITISIIGLYYAS